MKAKPVLEFDKSPLYLSVNVDNKGNKGGAD